MLKSNIKVINGAPYLYINDELTPAMAYTTYFEERSCYEDFIKAGYRIFFINVSFTTLPINSNTGFSPFRVGVFEDPLMPDYSEFEDAVKKILLACPEAIIFPRIYVSMPKWWIDSHLNDVVYTTRGGYREALFSEAFREDGGKMLIRLVTHIKSSDYADRIGGWQLCGGRTQEWFHHNYNGSLCHAAKEPYRQWVKDTYGEDNATLPTDEDFNYTAKSFNDCENARRYSLFCNIGVARSLELFAKILKEETAHSQVVGAFYGYSFESNYCVTFGSHALYELLDSEHLDFFSSPNAYTNNRAFGIDWADMMPVDSIKKHEKLCFVECDIRTHLTISIQEARPNEYPDDIYVTKDGKSVWVGPPTIELSCKALRKCFAHQITKASAIWWFDMWGGWYADPVLMRELVDMKQIYEKLPTCQNALSPQVALFADERAYANLYSNSPQLKGIIKTRTAMGLTGVPYDSFLVDDAENILSSYSAAVFIMPIPSDAGKKAMRLCEKMGIPYITATADHYELTAEELKGFYRKAGIHFYTEESDVIYVGNGYIGLHSATGGIKTIKLPNKYNVSAIFGTSFIQNDTDTLSFTLEENDTALFSLR